VTAAVPSTTSARTAAQMTTATALAYCKGTAHWVRTARTAGRASLRRARQIGHHRPRHLPRRHHHRYRRRRRPSCRSCRPRCRCSRPMRSR
jgi:hypothetical protein